jgi:hypothetical protein
MSTVLPMLIAGVILIAVGSIIIIAVSKHTEKKLLVYLVAAPFLGCGGLLVGWVLFSIVFLSGIVLLFAYGQ